MNVLAKIKYRENLAFFLHVLMVIFFISISQKCNVCFLGLINSERPPTANKDQNRPAKTRQHKRRQAKKSNDKQKQAKTSKDKQRKAKTNKDQLSLLYLTIM